jgi:hypothetical protein
MSNRIYGRESFQKDFEEFMKNMKKQSTKILRNKKLKRITEK